MNSYINIQVTVMGAKAQAQLRAMEAELARYRASAGAAAAAQNKLNASMKLAAIGKWGNQLQWAGRQLMYNFTLPIAIAGAAATKFYMDNEKGMTQLRKVYGDLSMSQEVINNETTALKGAFQALSSEYGINQAEVIKVGAAWAQAGSSGIALAKATDLTMRTMVLGELDAVKATESLIAIQAQYRFSTDELYYAIAQLNIIENQTGTSMAGLIEAMSRSAGVARTAGIDVQHLGAIIAALTPAAGSAAQAGNAIKTIISRLLAPTQQAVDLLGAMGINVNEMAWQSANASDRLVMLADDFEKLSDSQKAVVSSTLASRFQINKFEVLMDSITTKGSYYWKALEATADRNKVLAQATRELNVVMTSSPKTFERAWVILQNAMSTVIVPLIPLILGVANAIASLATKFSQLSPETQKTVAFLLLFLAAIGPLARYVGSVAQLISLIGRFIIEIGLLFSGAAKWIFFFIRNLTPVGWAITAALLIFTIFQDKIEEIISNVIKYFQNLPPGVAAALKPVLDIFGKAIDWVIRAFNLLPQGVQNAMIAVLQIVATIAVKVYEWFSYLNPFAHHSPSLVESVTAGMAIIKAQFASLTAIRAPIATAYADIKKFGQATADFKFGFSTFKMLEDLKKVKKYLPSAADEFVALANDVAKLQTSIDKVSILIEAQQKIVDAWRASLDAANDALDAQEQKLSDLKDIADAYSASLDAAQASLDYYANAPIAGMKAMDDQIFKNTIDQKKLRLEMMKLEDITGTYADLQSQLQSLNGDIEILRGTQAELTSAGAGSDITSFYDAQIKALEDQKIATQNNLSPLQDMQQQLDLLERKAEEMNLVRDLQFDPLTRQIEEASSALKELPFSEIMAGITASKTEIDKYTQAYNDAMVAVNNQKAAVDAATASRDAIQAAYDSEKAKLDILKQTYDDLKTAIDAANTSMQDIIQSIDEANQMGAGSAGGISPALKNFNAAAGGNFPSVGGTTGGVGREMPNIADQSALIDQFTKDTQKKIGDLFGEIDIFKPIREKWDQFVGWWNTNVVGTWNKFTEWLGGLFSSINFDSVVEAISPVWDWIVEAGKTAWGFLTNIWNLFATDFSDIWNGISGAVQDAWKLIQPSLKELWDTLGPALAAVWSLAQELWGALSKLWPIIKVIAAIIGGALLLAFKVIASVINNVVVPIINTFAGILNGVIEIITGIIQFITGVFTLDWGKAWDGIKNILAGVWDIIYSLISGFVGTIIGVVWGFITGIVGFFQWLWDNAVPLVMGLILGIVDWFSKLPGRVGSFVLELIAKLVKWFGELPGKIISAVATLGTKLWTWITEAWQKIKDGAATKWNEFSAWVVTVPGKIIDGLATLGGKLLGWIKEAWQNIRDGAGTKYDEFLKWVSGIPAAILKKLGDLKDTLYNSGKNLIQGLLDGAGSLLRTLGSWFLDKIPSWIRKPFEIAMGIGSPSKVFKEYGKNLMMGLGIGIDKNLGEVEKRVTSVTDTLRAVGDMRLSNVSAGTLGAMAQAASTGSLEALVARAEARTRAATNPSATVYGSDGGARVIQINGNLSFPNVTTGADAKSFLDNLEALAKG